MLNNIYVGWQFKIKWENGDVESFSVVDETAELNENKINCESNLVKELLSTKVGEEHSYFVDGFENKFKLLELTNTNIKNTIEKHNLTKLYHFTAIDNLPSILQYGILSKDQLRRNKIPFLQNDSLRLDNRTNFISCSLEYPNNRLLTKNKYNHDQDYCLIEIDVDILNHSFSACSTTNAASNSGKNIMSCSFIERLFGDPRPNKLPNNYTTNDQAEVLIKDYIPVSFIKAIVFENSFACSKYSAICPKNIKLINNYRLFAIRGDYE